MAEQDKPSLFFRDRISKDMKQTSTLMLIIAIAATLSACGNLMESSGLTAPSPIPTIIAPSSTPSVTLTPSVTATPDPCISSNLPNSIKPVNELMRQFDDYATLARSTAQSQLVQVIPPMQAIRRTAEDQVLPACLKQLKSYQISYMDTFLQTMLTFEQTYGNPIFMLTPAVSQKIKAGIAQAQQYHDQYVIEWARLLGVTLVPTSTPIITTPILDTLTPSSTPLPITITNIGTDTINLHKSASVNSPVVGKLGAGASTNALGKSEIGDWLLIQIPKQPGKTAWIYASLVTFSSGNPNDLPVATPAP